MEHDGALGGVMRPEGGVRESGLLLERGRIEVVCVGEGEAQGLVCVV